MKDFANSNEQSSWTYALKSHAFDKEQLARLRFLITRLQSWDRGSKGHEADRIKHLEALVTRHIEQIQKWEDRYPQLKEKSND